MRLAGRLRGSAGADPVDYLSTTTPLTAGVRWRVAGEQVVVRMEEGRSAGRWMVMFELLRDPGDATVDVMVASFAGAELIDTSGRRMRRGTAYRQESPGGGLVYRMEFIGAEGDRPAIPARLAATLPSRLVELDLPFTFTGLPMP